MKLLAHLLAPDGAIPNHPRWPLLVYPGAVAIEGSDPAAAFEALFARNRWPAGTGHKKLASRGVLGVVGAYPKGSHPATCVPPLARYRNSVKTIAAVPLPACDPVFGPNGPLFDHWIKA